MRASSHSSWGPEPFEYRPRTSDGVTGQREHQQIHRLILAAEGDDRVIATAIGEIGAVQVAGILADELISRADLNEIGEVCDAPVNVHLALDHDGGVVHHQIQAARVSTHRPGRPDAPHATIALTLTELVRSVFGPWPAPHGQNLQIIWQDLENVPRLGDTMHIFPVVHRLTRGTTRQPVDLGALSLRNGSDKWGLHYYTPHYERHFGPLRDRPLTILELGIGGYGNPASGGASLRMWKRFFPRAVIYGVDAFDKSAIREQRIHTVTGDLSDPAFLAALGLGLGPFDIVVDDGSHYCGDVIAAFHALFPYVQPGGLYAIEDLQTSYWPGYGGSATQLDDPETSVGFLKQLVDGLNHEERVLPDSGAPSETDRTVTGMHFYRSLAIVEKGRNAEMPSPSWIPRNRLSKEEMAVADWGEGLTSGTGG